MDGMTEPQRRRRRPAVSCTLCRRRKIKCNREIPCSNCKRSKNESCIYENHPSQPPRQRPGAQIQGLRPIEPRETRESEHHRIHSPVSLIDDPSTSGSPESSRPPGSLVTAPVTALLSPAVRPVRELELMKNRIKQLEEQLSQANQRQVLPNPSGETETASSFLGEFHLQHESHLSGLSNSTSRSVMHKSRLFGRSHWINGIVMWFRDVFEMIEPRAFQEDSKAYNLMRKCKALARIIKARRQPSWPTPPTPDLPPRNVADKLVDSYLTTMETVFRILHIPSFRRDYEALWEPGAKPDPAFLVQLKVVLAIGAVLYDTTFSLRPSALQWIYEGHTWMSGPEFKRRLTVQSLQTQLLLVLARDLVGVDEGSLWISLGSILRAAMHMGLHRDPTCLPKRTVFAAEMRRRLWNTILELALLTAMNSGGPILLSLEDFDTGPPGNYDDDQLTGENPSPMPTTCFTQSSVAIALRETFPIRLKIMKFLNDLSSHVTYEEALRLDAQMRSSYKILRASLQKQESKRGVPPPQFAIRIAELFMNRLLLSLHVLFFSPLLNPMTYAFSRKVVVESSLKIWHALIQISSTSGGASDPLDLADDLTRLVTCGSGFFRISANLVGMLIAAELKLQLQEDDSLNPVPLRQDLLSIMDAAKVCTIKAIERGETNIKGYIFTSLVNTQIECLIDGVEREEMVLRLISTAEVGEERCLKILEQKAAEGQPEGIVDDGMSHMALSTPPEFMGDWDFSDFSMLDTQFNLGSIEPLAWVFGDVPQGMSS